MYKRLFERRLDFEWLAQACTLPSPCVVSSQAFSINACQKFEKWRGKCRRGERTQESEACRFAEFLWTNQAKSCWRRETGEALEVLFLAWLPLDACTRVHSPALNLKRKTDCSQSTAVTKKQQRRGKRWRFPCHFYLIYLHFQHPRFSL